PGSGSSSLRLGAATGGPGACALRPHHLMEPTMTLESERTLDDLWPLIEEVRFAMLCTRDADGCLRSRPMTTLRRRDADARDVWFFTSRGTPPAQDIERDGNVNLAYASPSSDVYVS